ncbi:MAG: hypothetical protein ACI4J1_02870 [Ruminiclostridium sp.]
MKKIIKQVLDGFNWKYLEGEDVIKLDVEGESSNWSSLVKIEDEEMFSYYSVIPAKADSDRLGIISELLLRINYSVRVGSFEINLSDGANKGQIMLKTYGIIPQKLPEQDSEAAADIVRKVIAYNMLTMDFYAKPILKAIYSDETNIDEILKTTERGEQI